MGLLRSRSSADDLRINRAGEWILDIPQGVGQRKMRGIRSAETSEEPPPPIARQLEYLLIGSPPQLPEPGHRQIEILGVGAPEVATIQVQAKPVSYETGQMSEGQTSEVGDTSEKAKIKEAVGYETGQMSAGQTSEVGDTSEKAKIKEAVSIETGQTSADQTSEVGDTSEKGKIKETVSIETGQTSADQTSEVGDTSEKGKIKETVSYETGQTSAGQTSEVGDTSEKAKSKETVSYKTRQTSVGQTSEVGDTSEKAKLKEAVNYETGQTNAAQTSEVGDTSEKAKIKEAVNYETGQTNAAQTSEVGDTSEKAKIKEDKLVATIQGKLKHVTPLSTITCISRVPRSLRKVNEETYTPQLVSIGPYNHGTERLKAMEEHKMRYLSDFLDRSPGISLEDLVESLKKLEERARQCYVNPVEGDSNMFVEMMLLDGCFIIELFFKFWSFHNSVVVASDPIFHIASTISDIRVDMLLLENQLPLFILEHIFFLYTVGFDQTYKGPPFLELAVKFFNFKILLNITQDFSSDNVKKDGLKHFLDLLRECCLPSYPNALVINCNEEEDWKFIPGATELHKTGVEFRKNEGGYFMNLKFNPNGVFEIPTLTVEDNSEALFRNLVAFEQCFKVGKEHYICHYLALLDFLINSPNDVAILQKQGIIDNLLGDNESVTILFNKNFQGVHIFENSFHFTQLCKKVNNYYDTPWHSFKAMLFREYFYSPWSIASSIAVIIVVVCTIIQTVFSAVSTIKT